jgi:FKBP-type peptidyl-prolyl cis-trans isomerase SlyD
MKITKGIVATLNYVLTIDGEVVDNTAEKGPVAYLHGYGDIFAKIESALEGQGAGDNVKVQLAAADAYGDYDPKYVDTVPKNEFEGADELYVGQEFNFETENGEIHSIWIKDIKEDEVVIDGNHPLAGKTLEYDFSILEVREADDEEREHGHVHGPHGHSH